MLNEEEFSSEKWEEMYAEQWKYWIKVRMGRGTNLQDERGKEQIEEICECKWLRNSVFKTGMWKRRG